jgi:signal recognition particle subunit SRP54
MFDSLTKALGNVFDSLRGKSRLSDDDVTQALSSIRTALLEADVALPVVKDLAERIRAKATGQDLIKSVSPAQQVVKIVHDELIAALGSDNVELNMAGTPPVAMMMVGLQGSGKTTTTAKIAKFLTDKARKKVLMASLDTQRPAAQDQLRVLGEQTKIATLPIIAGQTPIEIAKRAMQVGKVEGYDVVLLDTAGRLAIDETLMNEVAAVKAATQPLETLLVADAMTGQDAVRTATAFNDKVGITGIVLTRIDGDARGGAALSMRAVTGQPIKLLGTGEKIDALEPFHPERLAGRILDMGDVVSLVEKAVETVTREDSEKMAAKFSSGTFDFNDMLSQISQMKRMGGVNELVKMLPGLSKYSEQVQKANVDDVVIKRQEAIIFSMTKQERAKPALLNASRKRRIAAGSGTTVQDINRIIKQHEQMATMMKRIKKMGMGGMMNMVKGFMGSKDAAIMDALQTMSPDELENFKDADSIRKLSEGGAPIPTSSSGLLGGGVPGFSGALPPGFPAPPRGPLGGLLGQLTGKLKK